MVDTSTRAIGRRIAAYRTLAGLTSAELGQRLSPPLSRSAMAKIETGANANISAANILSIARVLDVSPLALLLPMEREVGQVEIAGERMLLDGMVSWALRFPTPDLRTQMGSNAAPMDVADRLRRCRWFGGDR